MVQSSPSVGRLVAFDNRSRLSRVDISCRNKIKREVEISRDVSICFVIFEHFTLFFTVDRKVFAFTSILLSS